MSNRPIDEYRVNGTIKISVWAQTHGMNEPTFSITKCFWDRKLSTYRKSNTIFMNELKAIMVACAKVLARYNLAELEEGMLEIEKTYRVTREGANALSVLNNVTKTPLNSPPKNRLGEVD